MILIGVYPVMTVEAVLVTLTMFLLTQPRLILPLRTDRERITVTLLGVVLLGVTFCWSIWLGCVLELHHLAIRV